ncbi:hypothetical protein KP509_25G074200 [Ceratopteris richardii]|nr:hypothetical protein KP509_25G074200 [Ceratopteris richardii]
MKLKELLAKEPGMCMSLRELGKKRKKLGLEKSRRLVTLLKRYSAIFEMFEEGASNMYFRLSPTAEELFLEEQKLKAEMESVLVNKIRKLLMMSIDKTLLLYKISHMKRDLGLPDDFKVNLVEKYPQFFKVVELQSGPALELTSWDPELAVSAWERNVEDGSVMFNVKNKPLKQVGKRRYPRKFHFKQKDIVSLRKFHDMSYFSPYSEFAHLEPTSREAEKHACAVVHEILSMTLEKRLNIDFLTHFRRDYRFSQQIHGMLVRHPELFYVSLKGDRNSVFLREAYRGSELIKKDPLVLLKDKLRDLVMQDFMELGENDDDDDDDDNDDDDDIDDDDVDDFSEINDVVDNKGDIPDREPSDVRLNVDFNEAEEQSVSDNQDSGKQMPRRPLHLLQREQEMAAAAAAASVDRW